MATVAAIILAAGESSRFGKPKQLLQLNQQSLVRRIFDAVRAAGCFPITVVSGNAHDEVEDELRGEAVTIVRNENWRRGIGSSIRCGVQSLVETGLGIDAVVLLVCDQPLVNARTIRDLIAIHGNTNKAIVGSRYAATLGVPALFDKTYFDELLALDADSGAKTIILSNREQVAALEFPDGAIDIDTIEDWESFRSGLTV